jgi:diguanylate cyclase (GGDEF)-like protein
MAEGQVIGVLNCESLEPHAYHEDHVRTLSVVAQHLAVVLRTAQLHSEARRLSITDPLTSLYNRRFFMNQLEDAVGRAERYEHRLALVFGDLDRFKSINDQFGHHTGDRALQAVAGAMRRSLRGTDMLARMGGEEFAALLMEADRDRALQVAHRFRTRIQHLGFEADDGQHVAITMSAGIAMFPDHGASAASLLQHADAALYEAKRLGRDQIVVAGEAPVDVANV